MQPGSPGGLTLLPFVQYRCTKPTPGCVVQPPLPRGFTKQLFGGLYKQPICSLYARGNAKGFTGQCTRDLPKKCTHQDKWCGKDGSNAGSDLVEELMALQIAKVRA